MRSQDKSVNGHTADGKAAGAPTRAGALFAFSVGMVALIAVAEISLRWVMPHWREFYSGNFMTVVEDPKVGSIAVAKKNFDGFFSQNNGDFRVRIRINEFNLRNDEPVSAANGRIWVIGDSMAFGWGVDRDKIYTQVIAEKSGVPAYNVATPGVGICQWILMYERMPADVRPRAVIAGLNIENRMQTYACLDKSTAKEPAPPPSAKGSSNFLPALLNIKVWLTQRSALYNFLAISINRVGWAREGLIRLGLVAREHSLSHYIVPEDQADQAVQATADSLALMRQHIPAAIPFVVLVNPSRFELLNGNAHYRNLREKEVLALRARGIEVVDITAELQSAGFHQTHFAHDGHWSAAGHRIAGEVLAKRISEILQRR